MLVDKGYIEWQGSLRETYKKYLLPEVIKGNDPKVWDNICQGKVMNLFQFGDSQVGKEAIKLLQPRSMVELANANALMRLMAQDDGESPMVKSVKFKNNPQLWEQEMIDYGLTEEDRLVMHELEDDEYGVCSNQESMMMMFMHPKVANYGVKEVNLIKKGIAKKRNDVLEQAEKELYKRQKEIGTSKKLVDYCWNVEAGYQKGYGFSRPHCVAYSWIAYQEAYLYTYFPSIIWYVCNLISLSGSQDEEEVEDSYFQVKEQTTEYGKVAKAISMVQEEGVKVELPEINTSELGFSPLIEENEILFGLKGICGINNDTVKIIVENRPYSSLQDFYERLVKTTREVTLSTGKIQNKSYVSKGQLITLIKAGAFDKLENENRETILSNFLKLLQPDKESLTTSNINSVVEMGIVSEDKKIYIRYYNFKNFLQEFSDIKDEKSKNIKWKVIKCDNDELTQYTLDFLNEHFMSEMEEGKGYKYDEEGNLLVALGTKRKGSFEKVYDNLMTEFKEWLNSKECLTLYNNIRFKDLQEEYMKGSLSTWEMESLGMYYHEHELAHVNKEKYSIVNFNELPEEPVIIDYNYYKKIKYPKYELVRIVGTVLDRNKNKHLVTLLTPNGVITLKFYSGQFSFYDKTISTQDEETGKKITLENGWFKKGNKLLVTGFRRGDNFIPKRYKGSVFSHSLQLIKNINDLGDLELQSERTKIDELEE